MSGFSSFPFGALPALLLPWYASAARPLPWRETREPYRVWISEIMLQQTRVAAVLGYYARFLSALPDVAALAAVEEERLLKLWEGLGYYSRALEVARGRDPRARIRRQIPRKLCRAARAARNRGVYRRRDCFDLL